MNYQQSVTHQHAIPDELVEECARLIAGAEVWDGADIETRNKIRIVTLRVLMRSWQAAFEKAAEVSEQNGVLFTGMDIADELRSVAQLFA